MASNCLDVRTKKANPRIALISPQVIGDKHQVRKAQAPLGISYLAAVLEENGLKGDVMCLDAVVEDYNNVQPVEDDPRFVKYGLSDERIVERLVDFQPDLVGISTLFTTQAECAFSIAKAVKKQFPSVPLLMGANHASNTHKDIMANVDSVDYIIRGESEYKFLEFVRKYFSGQNFYDVEGLVRRESGGIVVNPDRPFQKNLDELPDPAFHLLPMERYFEIGMPHNPFVKSGRVASLMTSRGCPEHCYFCSSPEYTGTSFRAMSPGRVIQQVRKLVKDYKIKEIQILDDNFTVNHRRVVQICEGIGDLHLRITLPNAIRGDRPLDRSKRLTMFKAMREAGVEQFGMSVEHGDQDFLNSVIGKKLDLDEARATCDLAHEAGILVHASFMMGFPFETEELRKKTIDFSKSLDADSFSISLASPLPGTLMWDIVEKNNLFIPGYKINRMVFVNVSIIPEDISPEELKNTADKLNEELNVAAQKRSPETREKYKRFQLSGKSADGDRKYHFSHD